MVPAANCSRTCSRWFTAGGAAEPEAVSLGSLDQNELLVGKGWLVVLRGGGLVVGPGGTNNIGS